MKANANHRQLRPRSKLFRALGDQEPPDTIQIKNEHYKKTQVLKHDSWAATALYEGTSGLIICKFNRQQPIFGIPMKWLGKALGQRENRFLQLFADVPYLPKFSGYVSLDGQLLSHATAHKYIAGVTLRRYKKKLHDDFFSKLQDVLKIIHDRRVAYVDLNKQENILVDEQGDPYLIDFQICFHLSEHWPWNSAFFRWWLQILQRSDCYYLMKHYTKFRPDLFTPSEFEEARKRPWFLNVHRCIVVPLRTLRRRLLVLLGFRSRNGKATSELFVEEGLRENDAHKDLNV